MEFIFKTKEEYKKHIKLWGNEPKNYKILEEQEPQPETTTQHLNTQEPTPQEKQQETQTDDEIISTHTIETTTEDKTEQEEQEEANQTDSEEEPPEDKQEEAPQSENEEEPTQDNKTDLNINLEPSNTDICNAKELLNSTYEANECT